MSTIKKGFLQKRAEETVKKNPYKRQPKSHWMEEALEEVKPDLIKMTRKNPEISWEEVTEAGAS